MNKLLIELTGVLFFNFFHYTYCDYLQCDVHEFLSCKGANENCDEETSTCICRKGFERNAEKNCSRIVPKSSSSSATVVFVSIITIALICGGLYLIIRRYRLLDYVRHHITFRRSTEVQYEDVMIDRRDDLPIST